jgi:alpha-glucoside transport system permease protein
MQIVTRPGLRLEVAGREMSGPPATTSARPSWTRYLLGLPAVVLLAVLLVPMAWTTAWAFDSGSVFGNFKTVLTDRGALTAAWHSLLWVGIAVALLAFGYWVAVLSRHVQGLWKVLL